MKMPQTACALALFFLLFATISACKKDDENANPNNPNPDLATVSTDKIENISYDSALVFSTVSKEGKSAVVAMGIAWGKNPNPTVVSDNSIPYASFGVGTFRTSLRNLEVGTTYYVRSYATNAVGTAYSEQKSFSTKGGTAPTLTTLAASSIGFTSATSGGEIIIQGSSAVVERGIVWSTSPGPTIGVPGRAIAPTGGTGSFTLQMTGLTHSTQYYVRAYATNGQDTNYGNEQSFTTLAAIAPTLSTLAVTNILLTSATCGGNISNEGSSSIVERGIVWSTAPQPTVNALGKATASSTGTGTFSLQMTGLTQSTQYYVRAYVTNGQVTNYGNEQSFTTLSPLPSVSDIDGNAYPTVQIGSQIWMQANLRTARYRDGSAINTGLSDSQWQSTTNGAFTIYDNNAANDATYGKLFNWYAVTDPRGLCPVGWHVPTDAEWKTLEAHLGMPASELDQSLWRGESQNVGGKLKAVSSLWTSPNTGATDESGFSGLPGGSLYGNYISIGAGGTWWSSSEVSTTNAWSRTLSYINGSSNRGGNSKRNGFSVRCLRD